MKYLTAISLLCFISSSCSINQKGIEKKVVVQQGMQAKKDSLPFPEAWLGYWEGVLEIYRENKLVQEVPMALDMQEIDTSDNFVWAIIYGDDKEAGRRPYELETLNAEKGWYRVDEKNTIKLESYLFGDKLYNWFSVMNSMILCTYELDGDKLLFEIVSGSTEPVSITGNQKHEGEDIPEVKTFLVSVTQKAVLARKK